MLDFSCDYNVGAHPEVLSALVKTNEGTSGTYGLDTYSDAAREKIKKACMTPLARVHFLSGGTQTNATVLASLLAPYEGVISATTGHIDGHEAGAIELTGHKVMSIPSHDGKILASELEARFRLYECDESREHTVKPGAVYISQPTEYGTVYSLSELREISETAHAHGARLFIDGARLGYALTADGADATLADIAALSDVFYIGGTKLGALFGEAVVITNPDICPYFFTTVKSHGALLAKGRVLGVQFDALFTDDLYMRIGRAAVSTALRLKSGLLSLGYKLHIDSPSNQQFVVITEDALLALRELGVGLNVWERLASGEVVVRFVTSFATTDSDVDELLEILKNLKK